LREEPRLGVLGRISGPYAEEVTGDWRRLPNEELLDLFCSPNIIRVKKSRVKRPGRGDDHPPPSSAEVKEGAELHHHSPSGPL